MSMAQFWAGYREGYRTYPYIEWTRDVSEKPGLYTPMERTPLGRPDAALRAARATHEGAAPEAATMEHGDTHSDEQQPPQVRPMSVCGLPIVDMPEGITPLAALVVVKALDEDGDVTYYARATEGVSTVEALGMAALADTRLRDALTEGDDWRD